MKKFLRWAAFFAGAAVLDWWSGSFCVFYGSSAEIMMLAVICASAFSSPRAGQAFGFLSGLYIDFMGAKLFGGHALLFVIISHAVWVVKKRIEFDSAAPQLLMTFILSMLALWVYMLIGIIFSGEFTWRGWHYVLLTPLLNAAVSPLIFLAARRLLKEKPVFYL